MLTEFRIMEPISYILLLALTSCARFTCASPQDSSSIQKQDSTKDLSYKSVKVPPSAEVLEKEYPCPEDADIAPCVCWVDSSSRLFLDCSNITSNEALNEVFLNPFPDTEFYEFLISSNNNFTQLQSNCFGNVSFERIVILDTSINLVSHFALTSSERRLSHVHIYKGFLTESTFPFNHLSEYTSLRYLDIEAQNELVWVPPLTSSTLDYLALYGCSVASISPGNSEG